MFALANLEWFTSFIGISITTITRNTIDTIFYNFESRCVIYYHKEKDVMYFQISEPRERLNLLREIGGARGFVQQELGQYSICGIIWALYEISSC